MTKRMKRDREEAVAQAKHAADEIAARDALHPTDPVCPDIPKPDPMSSGVTSGWIPIGYSFNPRVERTWSESTAHGGGAAPEPYPRRCASQGGIALYSSELLAWKAVRNKIEREAGLKLTAIVEIRFVSGAAGGGRVEVA